MHRQTKKEIMSSDVRRAKHFIDITFAVSLCFAVILIIFLACLHQHTTFSSKRWKTQQEHRYGMLPQLLSEHKLYDMEKKELIRLLGYDQHRWGTNNADQLTYYLGRDPITCRENWLILQLKSNRVKTFYIHIE